MIALTSILVASFCFYAWVRLGKIPLPGDALRLFRVFFLLLGFSTFIGGIVGHAFMHLFPLIFKTPGWALGMIAVAAIEQASIVRARSFLGARGVQVLTWLNSAQLIVALSFVFATLWFPAVEIHSAIGFLLVVAPLEAKMYLNNRSAASRFMLSGILLLVGAVAIHILKLSVDVWFCYFDIAHLMMCAAIWMFMRGAEQIAVDDLRPIAA